MVDDFTALSDAVKTTARLAPAAGAGEVISVTATEAAGRATGAWSAAGGDPESETS